MKRRGISFIKRVRDINRVYDKYSRIGLSNRAIWVRYIYPVYGISERTFYNILKASARVEERVKMMDIPSLFDFDNSDKQDGHNR